MSHVFRSAIWFLLVPFPLTYGVPTALSLGETGHIILSPTIRMGGLAVVVLGTLGLLLCFVDFVRRGEGTPAPDEPPRHLLTGRLYRYSRNPMYVAVLTAIAGQALLWGNWAILAYGISLGITLHLWIVHVEEPALRKRFGQEYVTYQSQVPRWIGRGTREIGCRA